MGNRRYIGFKNDAERTKRKERSPIPHQMERAISHREHLGTSVKHYTCTGKHGQISPETSRGPTKAQSCHIRTVTMAATRKFYPLQEERTCKSNIALKRPRDLTAC